VVYDASSGGTTPLVIISKAAIALVMQQLGPNATEAEAINAILAAAGYTPFSNSDPTTGGGGGGQPQSQQADPSNSPGSTAGLNALGLSAYRGGGGTGGTSPFQGTGDDGGTTENNTANTPTGGGGGGGPTGPTVIAPTSP
jgi:hypothetical protein